MKKFSILIIMLAFLIPGTAFSYTAIIAFDENIDLTLLGNVSGITVAINPEVTLGAAPTIFSTTQNINGTDYDAALPAGWTPFTDRSVIDFVGVSPITSPGVAFSLEGASAFEVSLAQIIDYSLPIGADITDQFIIDMGVDITTLNGSSLPSGGQLFTISQVPIPSAVWLLAPGLLALIGIRRRVAR